MGGVQQGKVFISPEKMDGVPGMKFRKKKIEQNLRDKFCFPYKIRNFIPSNRIFALFETTFKTGIKQTKKTKASKSMHRWK